MTFDELFAESMANLKMPAASRAWIREAYAKVWNAAIDAVRDEVFTGENHPAVIVQDARKAVADYYSTFPDHLDGFFRGLKERANSLDTRAGYLKVEE